MRKHPVSKILTLLLASIMVLQMVPVTALMNAENNIYTNTADTIEDLADFKAYYSKNARDGLVETPFAEDWTVDGTVARLAKPHGIGGFWQSNVDGNGAYGYMAELVYTKQQYTDFELTVDAMQVAESIGRQFGIGFGKTELGAFFVDGSNQMNVKGGAYVGVERNGHTSLWGYAADMVSDTGAMLKNGRVSGTMVTGGSASSTWHTVKVRVEDGTVSMWVKARGAADSAYQQVLTNVALKDYTGGYISLMTNANAAFDNLSVTDLSNTAPIVEELADIRVNPGTPVSEIAFTETVKITHKGKEYSVPVTFACETYDADVPGEYVFQGTLDLTAFGELKAYELSVSMKVCVGVIKKEINISFDSAEELADFKAYYSKNAREGLVETPYAEDWTVDGTVARLAKPHGIGGFWQSNVDGNGAYGYMAELVYTKQQYTDFELTVDAMQVAESIGRQFGIGFGKTELGAFFVNGDNQMNVQGGAYVGVERNGHTSLWGYAANTVSDAGAMLNNGRVSGTMVTGGSASSTWHTVKVRVENSTVSMWVKDLGAEDSAYQQVLTNVELKDYTGGYISLMTNANAAFDNLFITDLSIKDPIVEATEDIQVNQGTPISEITFVETVKITYNGMDYFVPVTFACETYDAEVPGEYIFQGTLDLTGFEQLQDYALSVSQKVLVVSTEENRGISFDSAEDLADFKAYYSKNAKEGLVETPFAEDWTVDGTADRLAKPHGIGGFWQSNVDGNGAYGYMAELVYTKQQYTNFELTVDAMQVEESIGRQFGIGFGKTEPGAFFVDGDNQMNVQGGAYVGVERNGHTSLWGYAAATVNSTTGAMLNNGRVSGTMVTGGSACGTWHTVKVRVENGTVSMWVKALGAEDSAYQQVLTNVALKDYTGGYISLMTNANAAFDNLTIEELVQENPQLISVEAFEKLVVAQGTSVADIPFAQKVKAVDTNGMTHEVPVRFSCANYDGNVLGEYTFTGTLDLSGIQVKNDADMKASQLVVVKTQDAIENTVEITFDKVSDLADFTAYYADDAKKGLQRAIMEEHWTLNNGVVERVQPAGKQYWMSNANVAEQNNVGSVEYGMVAELAYTAKRYVNFELDVDVRKVSGITRYAAIGFGKADPAAFFINDANEMIFDGGAYATVIRANETCIWGYLESTVNANGMAMAGTNVRVTGSNIAGEQGQWCHVRLRVENGTATMWVDSQQVATAELKDYAGGYIVLHTSANAAFDNLTIYDLGEPEYPRITSISSVADLTVKKGTQIKDIPFPQTVKVTDANGVQYSAQVQFICDNYDPAVAGTYYFTGKLDMDRLPLSNPDNLMVTLKVEVETEELTQRTVRINFEDASELTGFTAYYADDAKKGYEKSPLADNWEISEDGTLVRIKPAGKEFWWTNPGKYGDTDVPTYQHFGMGVAEFGMVANLIYTERTYVNFVLDVDVKCSADITRPAMIGFGQTPGAFFQDAQNVMHQEGGLYAYINKGGETALFGYAQHTVNGANGQSGNNSRVLGERISYTPGEWVHLQLQVQGQNAKLYANGQLVCEAALKGYFGGYISLATSAGAEYDNLIILDNGDGCIGNITGVETIMPQTAVTGISPGSYALPSHVMVNTDIGRMISVPVDWSCENFSLYKAGSYSFTGKLRAAEAALRNPENLAATATVKVKMADIGDKTVIITFDDMSALDAFTATYALDASKNSNFEKADAAQYWKITDGMLSRLEQQFHYEPNADFNKIASLTYTAKTYKEFELNVDFVHGTMTYKWPMVAFGQKQAGSFAMEDGGGIIAYVEREGLPVLWGEVYEGNARRNRDERDKLPGYYMKDRAGNVLTHHMRLVVAGGYVYFYVDHYDPVVYTLPESYNGGYISLIANNNVKFDNLMITDLSETKAQTVVSVERFDGMVLDGLVELPRFVTVTTDQGYEYACPVTWKSPDYSRTKAGTYNFIGTLTMPFKNLKNPDNIQALIKAKYTIDYNPGKTVKFYFDHPSDLRQFELFYARSVDSGFEVMDPLDKFRLTEDGWLYRVNEDFSRNKIPKDEQTDKVAILTYKGGTYKDFELNVDIKNGTKTYFWAMIGFGQTMPGTFVTEEGGGYYAYTEKEGRPIFWGSVENANHEKTRIRPPTLWYDDFDPAEVHHLRLVVYDGVASLYVDDYNVPLVAKLTDDYIGGYISLVCGANDVSYDNLSITELSPKEAVEHTDTEAYDLLSLGTGLPVQEQEETQPTAEQETTPTEPTQPQQSGDDYTVWWILLGIAGAVLIALIIILGKKKSGKEGKTL